MQTKLIILMKENNVTIRFLADLIKISDKQFSKKLKGKYNFTGDEMFKIANYFGLKVEDIFLPTTYQNGTN